MRERLPNRRPSVTFDFDHAWPGHKASTFSATLGFYPDGRLGEVFLAGRKVGSGEDIAIRDSAIALSLALQYGCPPDAILTACLHNAAGEPEGPLGTLLGLIAADGYLSPPAPPQEAA